MTTRITRGGHADPVSIVDSITVPVSGSFSFASSPQSPLYITYAAAAATDAFARQRMSQPVTLFDSKQIFDNGLGAGNENQPLFWDNQETSGTGTSTTFNVNRASTTLQVTDVGTRVRQSRMRFNYQPGKSNLVVQTFILGSALAAPNVTKRLGLYDDQNGFFLQQTDATMAFGLRSYATGAAVDNIVTRANWDDPMDGSGASRVDLDFSKAQILFFDLEWLGVGTVRFGFFVDGVPYYAHRFNHANNVTAVYMSTPNLPVRWEISQSSGTDTDTLETICATVISEGGLEKLGVARGPSPASIPVIQANSVGTTYILAGLRLKAGFLGLTVLIERLSAIASTGDDYSLSVHFNPTLSGAVSWTNIAESGLQYCYPPNSSPGVSLTSEGYVFESGVFVSTDLESTVVTGNNAVRLGANIAGTPDEIWLCATPIGANLDIRGAINWREIL